MEIRAEKPEDIAAIRCVHEQAFQPRVNEAQLVELLRQANKLPIALVALQAERLVGHVAFSPLTIAIAPATIRGLGLAPVAVLPELQKKGIGSKLIAQGLENCRRGGYDLAVVLGDPNFYARFGFVRAADYYLENEYNADEAFRVIELQTGASSQVKGLVKYRPELQQAGC